MTGHAHRAPRLLSRIALVLLALVVAVLTADYVRMRIRTPRDAVTVAALQREAEADRARAADLAAVQDRVTRERQARKRRTDALAILGIAAAAAFVAGEKWARGSGPRRPSHARRAGSTDPAAVPSFAVPPAAAPLALDLTFVEELVAKHGRSKEAAIPILQAIQAHYRHLPDEALRRVCDLTDITPGQIAGTSTFYSRFRRSPVGAHVVRVCHGTACHVSGARQVTEELRRQLRIPDDTDTDPSRQFTIEEVACIGCCSLAPVLMVDDETAGRLTPSKAVAALSLVRRKEPA